MKKIFALAVYLIAFTFGFAQTKLVKIVFDVTSKDTLTHQATIRHVSLMSNSYPDSQFEIVIYGGALPMVLSEKSRVSGGIQTLMKAKNVSIMVCGETMKRQNVDKSQLLPGVGVVPDAIMEIVTKQNAGWGYIKEAN